MNLCHYRCIALVAAGILLFAATGCRSYEEVGYVASSSNLRHAESEMDAIGRPETATLIGPRASTFRSGAYSGESLLASIACNEVIKYYESKLSSRAWNADPERLGTHTRGTYYYVQANTNWRAVLEIRTDSNGPPCAYLFAVFPDVK